MTTKKSLSLDILKHKREELNLSVKDVIDELAKRSIILSEKALYGYENGVGTPRVNTFIALCDIYGITDILGTFGYAGRIPIAVGDCEWSTSEYNDFFNAPLLDKVYFLLRHGVPSFAGYEEQLNASFPNDANAAMLNRIHFLFSAFKESQQSQAFFALEEIAQEHTPSISADELDLIRACRSLNEDGKQKLYDYADDLVSSKKYTHAPTNEEKHA